MSNWKKTHTISVKTGSYTTRDGQTKNRYENIGRVMTDSETGGKMYFLNRTFNPAGCPKIRDDDDAVLLSIFEDRPKEGQLAEDAFPDTPPALSALAKPPEPAKQPVTVGAGAYGNGEFPIY